MDARGILQGVFRSGEGRAARAAILLPLHRAKRGMGFALRSLGARQDCLGAGPVRPPPRLRRYSPRCAGGEPRARAMKFTLSWLKDHLETGADAQTVGDKLTSIGLEVESIEDAGARLKDFTVAHVISAEKHPDADKLKLCMVDAGSGEPVQVVCGAPNAHTGMT